MAKTKDPKEITTEFKGAELRALGLPTRCNGGEVLEDRLVERVEVTRKGKDTTDEMRFLIVRMADGIWGFNYTKHESGRVTFDDMTHATRYEYRMLLVQADDHAKEERAAA